MSWWDLGEWSGYHGETLATYQIACAFCGEKGNFETTQHLERKKPGGISKVLNYDTLKCGHCGNYMFRRAAIENFYAEDCALYVPPGVFVGHDALEKFAGDLRATHPHFVYTPHGEAQAQHNGGILAWGSGPKGEAPDYTGLDVVIVRDGKIAALYVFLNPKFA